MSFPAAMVLLGLVALAVAVVAVRRGWRVESGQRMLYWSVGAALLILFSSAAFQLATNLPVIQELELQPNERVVRIVSDGSRGVVFTSGFTSAGPVERAYPIRISASGIELRPPLPFGTDPWEEGARTAAWSPRHPDLFYCLHFLPVPEGQRPVLELWSVRLDAPNPDQAVKVLFSSTGLGGNLYEVGNRLYVPGDKLFVFDISDPMQPKMSETEVAEWGSYRGPSSEQGPVVAVSLRQIPDLSPRQRLEMRMAEQPYWVLEGDALTMAYFGPLTTYRLSKLTPQFARFDRVGIYSAPMLEQFFGDRSAVCREANGLVYESIPATRSVLGGPRITVFDVRNLARPRPVAHFAAPDTNSQLVTCPLPDGRALIGGDRLYLVGPPPGGR